MNGGFIDPHTWRRHAGINRLQSLSLLLFMGVFLALLGWLLWGLAGIVWLVLVGVLGVFLNPSTSPRWVMRMYRASPVNPSQAPELSAALSVLAQRAQLPAVPDLYYVPSNMLNAFAVGSPQRSAVAVSDGLLRRLDLREVLGVLAHEISHIRSNDLWVMGLADMFSRATSLLSLLGQFLLLINLPLLLFSAVTINWLAIALLILAPSLASLAQLALSRTREYDADLNAARLTGDPEGLAAALLKIEEAQGGWMERVLLPGRNVPAPSLLRTHPETADRVARLRQLRREITDDGRLGLLGTRQGHMPHHAAPVVRRPRWHIDGLWH